MTMDAIVEKVVTLGRFTERSKLFEYLKTAAPSFFIIGVAIVFCIIIVGIFAAHYAVINLLAVLNGAHQSKFKELYNFACIAL